MASQNLKPKKRSQGKYPKPTQPIYRPPSARVEAANSESAEFNSSTNSIEILGFGNNQPNVFPIKGVLKRSKSFGNNRNSGDFSSSLLDETANGRFLLSMEGLSWENLNLIKQALDKNSCSTLSMTQLLQIIRILCNKVLEKPINSKMIAKVCLEIHHRQQVSTSEQSDHRYLFLESLANCLREWFNERDKLRFTTGGARRWIAYIFFIMEIYLSLKESSSENCSEESTSGSGTQSHDSCVESDEDSNNDDNSDEEVCRAFSVEIAPESQSSTNNGASTDHIVKQSHVNIENKIINSLLSKQQKQFSNLLLDSFQVILSNPNTTPAEIECMQTVFRKCGRYLENDNSQRIKAMIFIIRDALLNSSTAGQFINANNSSNHSSITKNLLEIIELSASSWNFTEAQQIYYFPYTKMD